MPRFRKGTATSPLLPAHGASSLGLSKKKPPASIWASLGEAGLALVIAGALFAAIIYFLMSLEARRSAALHSRPSKELPGTQMPTKNAALQKRLDALIEEATKIAQEQGILTEVDAAENARLRALNKEEDWSWILDANDENIEKEIKRRSNAGQCSSEKSDALGNECGPHGVCISNQCSCAVAFSGTFCGHSVLLSHPYTPPNVSLVQLGYEGDLLLLQASKLDQKLQEQLKIDLETMRQILPFSDDDVFKGHQAIFESCAVVGASGSLLLSPHYGPAIDSHSFVFRIGALDTNQEKYKEYVGTKTRVQIATSLPEKEQLLEFFSKMTAENLLALPFSENLERLRSYSAANNENQRIGIIHPRLVEHVTAAFGSSTTLNKEGSTAETAAVMLALNTCRSVTIYGLVSLPKLPKTYYNKCSLTSAHDLQRSWLLLLEKYNKAGLIELGERCIVECLRLDTTTAASSASSGGSGSEGENKCDMCRKEHNLDPKPLDLAMKACS